MDLFTKVGIVVIVLIIIAAVIFVVASHTNGGGNISSSMAQSLVVNDIKSASPNANITVVSVTPSTLESGSWSIVLAVAYNATRPCPTLSIEGFDYPATGLVPSVDSVYTSGCVIYGISQAPSYVISSPLIAIARSYNQSSSPAQGYVSTFGYNSTAVSARYYATLNSNVTPLNSDYYNVWLVNYTARYAKYSLYVLTDSSGHIIANYTQNR
ncbi:MAG: hypothetical protein KGH60_02110 [Candidatus Micrarchaeota archaeon]|nr:hypothetical protein [Candidatus Micrarchaeota archaeon]